MTGPPAPDGDPFVDAARAAAELARLSGHPRHDVLVVLGTALAPVAATLAAEAGTPLPEPFDLAEVSGIPTPTGPHHSAAAWSLPVAGHRVLVTAGRLHLYEGHHPWVVAHPVRAAAAAGCHTVVLTNAAGGIRPDLAPGAVVLIADHLNLTGTSPLVGVGSGHPAGSPFVELAGCWSPRLRHLARQVEPSLPEGVYAHLPGPHFETPAEVRMLATLGADLVGMSTVPEAIAARHLGAEVLGLSVVVNPATGTPAWSAGSGPDDLVAAAAVAVPTVARVIAGVVGRL